MTQRDRITLRLLVVGYFLMLVALPFTQGCGPTAREKTLSTTLLSVNAARDGFIEWDKQHQIGIVDHATSIADGTAKLVAYREKRETVLKAFVVAYRALALAAIREGTTLVDVAQRVQDLVTAIVALKSSGASPPP